MNYFEEINALRKDGKLNEAMSVAEDAQKEQPDNVWIKRAVSWVYYAVLKQNESLDKFDEFKEALTNIINLGLPDGDVMIFDNCAWKIGKMLFAIHKSSQRIHQTNQLDELFQLVKLMKLTRPSDSYSFLYSGFHSFHKEWDSYLAFADWWGLQYFRTDDYVSKKLGDTTMMSLVEQAYIAYSKKLIEHRDGRIDSIHVFLPKMDLLIQNHPEMQYVSYYKAKLLLATGQKDNVLSSFLPFALQNNKQFWVWQVLAEIYSDVPETRLACLCKALQCRSKPEFFVKLRLELARLLIDKQLYSEAKTEIEQVIRIRTECGWPIPQFLKSYTYEAWFKHAPLLENNHSFYQKYAHIAEDILFETKAGVVLVIESVNTSKYVLNFITETLDQGYFNYKGFLSHPNVGDVLTVRFMDGDKNGYYRLLSAKHVEKSFETSLLKSFNGKIRILNNGGFGLVDDVFIDSCFIESHSIKTGCFVEGTALKSFNKKKKQWGWKAFIL